MKCPSCSFSESKVIDSRSVNDGQSIRRRRECLSCQKRFTTYEILDTVQLFVLKKDGSKEFFDRRKLLGGLIKACQKRPVDTEAIVADIERELQNSLCTEIESTELGKMVMERLRKTDAVSYVRFASVYREFKDVDTFVNELNDLIEEYGKNKPESAE